MNQKSNLNITFRINEEQKQKIERASKKAGLPIASFCRFKILDSIKQKEMKNESTG